MKLFGTTHLALLGTFLTFGVACGSSSSKKDDAPAPAQTGTAVTDTTTSNSGTDASGSTSTGSTGTSTSGSTSPSTGTALTPASCQDYWTKYVAAHPKGLDLAYDVSTVTKDSSGKVLSTINSPYEDVVSESSDAHVVTKHTQTVNGISSSSDQEMKKDDYINACTAAGNTISAAPDLPDVKLTAQDTVSVTVKGGTFSAKHVKGTASLQSGATGTVNFENWTTDDASGILLKTVTSVSATAGGVSFTNDTIIELTKIKRP